jgi:hypothetical protein
MQVVNEICADGISISSSRSSSGLVSEPSLTAQRLTGKPCAQDTLHQTRAARCPLLVCGRSLQSW